MRHILSDTASKVYTEEKSEHTEVSRVNNGTFQTRIGKHGTAGIFYDAERDTYYGCSKAKASDYFYATYDADSPLAEAFNGSVTWEMLVRPDALGDQGGNIDRIIFERSDQRGGRAGEQGL